MYGEGVLLKIKRNEAIVFSNDATYVTIKRKKGMRVGQRIWFTDDDIQHSNVKTLKHLYWVAAAVIIALFLLPLRLINNPQTFAYFSIDINPSIEISVDSSYKVIKVFPKNQQGKEIVKELNLTNKEIEDAIMLIVDKSKLLGYFDLENKTTILVASVLSGEKGEDETSQEKLLDIQYSIKEKIERTYGTEVVFKAYIADLEVKKAADSNNVSIGRESIFSIMEDAGLEFTLEDVKNMKVIDMIKAVEETNISSVTDSKGKTIIKEVTEKDLPKETAEPRTTPNIDDTKTSKKESSPPKTTPNIDDTKTSKKESSPPKTAFSDKDIVKPTKTPDMGDTKPADKESSPPETGSLTRPKNRP